MIATGENAEVTRYARLTLFKVGVGDRLPTPVDDIVASARLTIASGDEFNEARLEYLKQLSPQAVATLGKVLGAVDLLDNVVYLKPGLIAARRSFVKLHESGHKVLPWQREALVYCDDDASLSREVRTQFDVEANQYAADCLFQIDRFDCDARDLPLTLRTPKLLAGRYQASIHASIRRYVEHSDRACAVLVVKRIPEVDSSGVRWRIRQFIDSAPFKERFGDRIWGRYVSKDSPLGFPLAAGWTSFEEGEYILTDTNGRVVQCVFEVFDNTYDFFIFIYPADARMTSLG